MQVSKNEWQPGSRSCSFSLCLQGGSVFADFDVDALGRVSLLRISFDGYGCIGTGPNISQMSDSDSRTLIQAIDADQVDREEIRDILYRYFERNINAIWRDALEEHELIRIE